MPTLRQNILADIKSDLFTIPEIKHVEVNRRSPVDLDKVPLPAAFVDSGEETEAESQSMGYEEWVWTVFIQVWARDTDMETLLQKVHNKMYEDTTRGGNAIDTKRTGADVLDIDPTRSLVGIVMPFRIRYRHQYGVM